MAKKKEVKEEVKEPAPKKEERKSDGERLKPADYYD